MHHRPPLDLPPRHAAANATHALSTVENDGPTTHPSTHLRSLLQNLKPSQIADYKYHPDGQEGQLLRRTLCTPGTRVRILEAVGSWAKDTSTSAESLYWLFGSAGSGKSTIAYTIATETNASASATLGGNFFCSRQFDATRYSKRIIPTLAYHLARQCSSFAEALVQCDFEVVHQNPRAQLEEFFAKPWLQSMEARASDPNCPASYLVIIDALDEIQGDGGTELLRSLLDMINDERLPGLKFFVTSRPNPAIVRHVESFANKKMYRLEEIPIDEAEADIETYLNTALPHFKGSDAIAKLVHLAAGLFIFAVTVVKHLTIRYPGPREQRSALKKLLSINATASISVSPTQTLDQLYIQVLAEAFADLDEEVFASRLHIAHAFLCAAEPTSAAVISRLLPADDDGSDEESSSEGDSAFGLRAVVDDVVQRLYSVLYVENGRVLSYHKSFPDFIFDKARSERFWCDQLTHHRRLTTSSLQVLSNSLRFNIAEIPSSYIFDKDNEALQNEVHLTKHIPPYLRYACRHWAHHLERSGQHNNDHLLLSVLADFIHLPALFWIEAMNILGWVALCDAMLQTASEFVPPDDDTLKQAFGEAANFALFFSGSPASQSTPHLYISALATWNRPAYPVAEWKSHFPGIPDFTSTRFHSAALMKIQATAHLMAVAISTDGKLIAGGLLDGLVQIWDARVGNLLGTFKGHTDWVTSVLFLKGGTRIMSASQDTTIRVWEVDIVGQLQVLRGHSSGVQCACISPDESRFASGTMDGSICIWEAETGRLLKVLRGHKSRVVSISYSDSPTACICSGSDDQTIRIWDVESGRPLFVRGHGDGVAFVAFSPNGHSVISVSRDGVMWLWDRVTFAGRRFLDTCLGGISAATLSCDGSRILLCSSHGLQIRDVATGDMVAVLGKGMGWGRFCTFSANGKRAVVTGGITIEVWDASSVTRLGPSTLQHETSSQDLRGVVGLAVSYDGHKILLASPLGEVRLWEDTGPPVTRRHRGLIHSVGFSKDNLPILSVSTSDTLQLLDASTGHLLEETRFPRKANWRRARTTVLHDGSMLIFRRYRVNGPDLVHVWDVSKQQLVQTFRFFPEEVHVVATGLSQDGAYAAAGAERQSELSMTHMIHVWETSSGELICRLEATDEDCWSPLHTLEFSSDCSRLVSVSVHSVSARVWDMATGTCICVRLGGYRASVESVAFSPDGMLLASCSDRTVRLWDARTGKPVGDAFRGHTTKVSKVIFSPKGRSVISCSDEGEVRVWDITFWSTQVARYRVQRLFDPSTREDSSPTGWLLDRDSDNPLICLPIDNMVPDPSNIIVLPCSADPSLSFYSATLGPNWESCYAYF